jgi:hypothetical protein
MRKILLLAALTFSASVLADDLVKHSTLSDAQKNDPQYKIFDFVDEDDALKIHRHLKFFPQSVYLQAYQTNWYPLHEAINGQKKLAATEIMTFLFYQGRDVLNEHLYTRGPENDNPYAESAPIDMNPILVDDLLKEIERKFESSDSPILNKKN